MSSSNIPNNFPQRRQAYHAMTSSVQAALEVAGFNNMPDAQEILNAAAEQIRKLDRDDLRANRLSLTDEGEAT